MLSLKSKDFLRQKKKSKVFRSSLLTLLVSDTIEVLPAFGVIVTKKLGGSVVRNRIKRRIKSAALLVIDKKLHSGLSFIVIPKIICLNCTFDLLCSGISACVSDFHRFSGKKALESDALSTFCGADHSL